MKTLGFVAFLVVLGWSGFAAGAIITLTDLNSVARLDTDTQAGLFTLSADGMNAIFQKWFWYRVGTTGAEQSLDTLGAPTISLLGTSGLRAVYANSQFRVTLNYSLMGADAGTLQSDLGIAINVKNLTSSALDFHFFDYLDADLNAQADPGHDTVTIDPNTGKLEQTRGTAYIDLVTSLTPSRYEAGLSPGIINKLKDGVASNLSDTASAGPGDVTGALQWDLPLAAGASRTWSEDLSMQVPEPATLGLLALGGLGLLRRRRRG